MAALFKIGEIDYTSHIVAPTYSVDLKPLYDEWVDANRITHREVVRKRIEGKFTMKFYNISEYNEFLENLHDSETLGGYVICSLYANCTRTMYEDVEVFFELDLPNEEPFISSGGEYEGFEVTVVER